MTFSLNVKGGEKIFRKMCVAINDKGGDCWQYVPYVVIDVNLNMLSFMST